MSLSPFDGMGLLWQLACGVLSAVSVSARGQRRDAYANKGAPRTSARRGESSESPTALVVVPPADRVTNTFSYAVVKRLFDLTAGSVFFVMALPLYGAIALGIALTLGRPVLFSQQRVGRRGRLFRLYKFRTLDCCGVAYSEVEWSAVASHPFAAFLRRTGLDELPQMVHVLRGQMSLVGPRPERPHFVEVFQRQMPHYTARHRLQAGITGWAQVHGLRGDTSIRRRLDHDLFYLKHWSLGTDLRILALTLRGLGQEFWRLGRQRRFDSAGVS